MNGRKHSVEAWYDYLDRFHTALPVANETLFTNLRTAGDRSSYEVLARAAAAAGGRDVLDVGCGNGCLMNELLEAFPDDTRFTGIDMCAAEIEAARTTFASERRVRFERARAETLPFGDASFDVVVSHQTLNFFPIRDPRSPRSFACCVRAARSCSHKTALCPRISTTCCSTAPRRLRQGSSIRR